MESFKSRVFNSSVYMAHINDLMKKLAKQEFRGVREHAPCEKRQPLISCRAARAASFPGLPVLCKNMQRGFLYEISNLQELELIQCELNEPCLGLQVCISLLSVQFSFVSSITHFPLFQLHCIFQSNAFNQLDESTENPIQNGHPIFSVVISFQILIKFVEILSLP